MPQQIIKQGPYFTHVYNKYSPEEMPNYWVLDDRYIRDAKNMNGIVVECGENDAKEIAAYFVNNLFAIPTCTYYDGKRLSICCSYAGRNTGLLIEKTEKFISSYFKKKQYS